ncbi:hypothetical protein [Rhodanobacter ginsengiterrae]|uniref:hypothetical protein n=1 Tax=Rhodanobacter ginsengiterrae TaxID=2008451 RepID=UPI003CEB5C81
MPSWLVALSDSFPIMPRLDHSGRSHGPLARRLRPAPHRTSGVMPCASITGDLRSRQPRILERKIAQPPDQLAARTARGFAFPDAATAQK